MSTVAFDTLEATEDLKAAGFEEACAKAIVRTVHRAMSEGMATKEHVSAEAATLRADLQTLRADMHALLLKTAVGIVIANVTGTIALMKLLP